MNQSLPFIYTSIASSPYLDADNCLAHSGLARTPALSTYCVVTHIVSGANDSPRGPGVGPQNMIDVMVLVLSSVKTNQTGSVEVDRVGRKLGRYI